MDDRRRTLAAITIIVGFIVLVIVVIGVLVSAKKVLSPVPDEGAIKVIFVTPTPPPAGGPIASPTATLAPTATPRPTAKPRPTSTPTPTSTATPSATTTP